jgi:hypothetical protein
MSWRSRRGKIIIAVAVAALIALAVGLTFAFTGGDTEEATLTHQQYAELFANAQIQKTKISVLDQWPKPYQTYHDSYQHQCYEWWDKGAALYSLCFQKGTLVNKDIL